jgi:hypothetical protein
VVPPISKEMRFGRPRRRPISAAAITPAAGPDSTAMVGMRSPSLTEKTPPLDPITHGAGRSMPVTAVSSRARYEVRIGPT